MLYRHRPHPCTSDPGLGIESAWLACSWMQERLLTTSPVWPEPCCMGGDRPLEPSLPCESRHRVDYERLHAQVQRNVRVWLGKARHRCDALQQPSSSHRHATYKTVSSIHQSKSHPKPYPKSHPIHISSRDSLLLELIAKRCELSTWCDFGCDC